MQLSFASEWIFLRGEALKDNTVFEHQLSIGTLHAIFLSSNASFTHSWWLSRLLLRRLELTYVILLLINASTICCSIIITINFLFEVCRRYIIRVLFLDAQIKLFFVVFCVVNGVWLFCSIFRGIIKVDSSGADHIV